MFKMTTGMPSRLEENPYDLPSQYQIQRILGRGGFGVVLSCLKKDTQESVAIKVPIYSDVKEEAALLKKLLTHNCHKRNIVKLLDSFNTRFGKALVFEELDISLMELFVKNERRPMLLSDIRSIIRQTARALEALTHMGVIHTDIKPDNIMLVDESKRPLEIKIIDFGLAIPLSKAKRGKRVQVQEFRAPEVILGLPLTEAIDMWSLGCVMAIIVAGGLLFSGDDDYELLRDIVHLLGQPPDRLLNKGIYAENYFIQTKTKGWRFKTPQEYWRRRTDNKRFGISSLDELKKARYETLNKTEGLEREQCIELLKAMLTLDAAQRITPRQVLSHPFILWNSTSEDSDTSEDAPQPEDQQKECTHSVLPQVGETSRQVSRTGKNFDCLSPAAVPADNTNQSAVPVMRKDECCCQLSQPLVINIQPAPPENTAQTDRFLPEVISISRNVCRTSSIEHCPLATAPEDKENTNIQPDNHSPPACVIYIQPAPPENTWENLECDSLQPGLTKPEPFVTDKDNDTEKDTSMPEDSTAFGEKQPPLPSSPVSELSPKKKKKKNFFRRLYSWMKKNFCSCMTCVDEEE